MPLRLHRDASCLGRVTALSPLDESLGALQAVPESATGGDADPCSGGKGMVCQSHPGAMCLCLMQ